MTHINAYFVDVEEADKKVAASIAELEAAKLRLQAKKEEDGYVEVPVSDAEEVLPELPLRHKK